MADRWAAAAMMAGHPNDASLLPLRNLPFALFGGGNDAAYKRNEIVAERAAKLDELEKADPGDYVHMARIYPGLPHWMNRKDAEALPWMGKQTRQVWPKKIIWVQDDVIETRFYWLAVSKDDAKEKQQITAEVEGQKIRLSGDVPPRITIRLSDELLDLDQPVQVSVNGREVFHDRVKRSAEILRESLQERADPSSAASASIVVREKTAE